MKYINKEYGIPGRPPMYGDYVEESSTGPSVTAECYPPRASVGLGCDLLTPNGVIAVGELGSIWGVDFSYSKNGKYLGANDFISAPGRYIASSSDGRFRYITYGDVTVTMVKYAINAVVISVTALQKTKLKLSFRPLTANGAEVVLDDGVMRGNTIERPVVRGKSTLMRDTVEIRGRYFVEPDGSEGRRECAVCKIVRGGENAVYDSDGSAVTAEIALDDKASRVILYMAVGDVSVYDDIPAEDELFVGVSNAELEYSAGKTVGSGALVEHVADAFSLVSAHRVYNPLTMDYECVEDRTSISPKHYVQDSADATTATLASALIGAPIKSEAVRYARDPAMGAISVWITYARTRDKNFLSKAYEECKYAFKQDTVLITVNPFDKKEIAYKQPGNPLKNIKADPLYGLEINSYKLLWLDLLPRMATVLGYVEEADNLQKIHDEFLAKFNDTFFNGALGIYADRYVSGEFSYPNGAQAFLPLVSGAVTDNDVLDALLLNLADKRKYWNKTPVPTLSKEHPSYGRIRRTANGDYLGLYEGFTGASLARLNYLIYLGLVRVGAEREASEFALKCVTAFNRYYKRYHAVPDRFLPNARIDAKSAKDSTSGNLNALIGISELIDLEYFRSDLRPSLRFGTMLKGTHGVGNVNVLGRRMTLDIRDGVTALCVNDKKVFECVGGAVVVRNFTENADGVEFMIYARSSVTLTVRTPIFGTSEVQSTYRFNLDAGSHSVVIEGGAIKAHGV